MLFAESGEVIFEASHGSITSVILSGVLFLLSTAVVGAVRSLIKDNRKLFAMELGSAQVVKAIEGLQQDFEELTKSFNRETEAIDGRWQKADKDIALLEQRVHSLERKDRERHPQPRVTPPEQSGGHSL